VADAIPLSPGAGRRDPGLWFGTDPSKDWVDAEVSAEARNALPALIAAARERDRIVARIHRLPDSIRLVREALLVEGDETS
jgi:hypothetical protein